MQWKKHKYGAKPTVVNGIRFASKKEARRYHELLLMDCAGEIDDLVLQPRFPLEVLGVKICTYVGDFSYINPKSPDLIIVEDVKGVQTDVFKLKKKLFDVLYRKTHRLIVT